METTHSGPRTHVAALGIVLLAGTLAALAQTATFDFTGHWTGSAQQTRKSPIAIAANFATGTAPQTFTGMFFASTGEGTTLHCTANGKQKRHDQVKTRLAPSTTAARSCYEASSTPPPRRSRATS